MGARLLAIEYALYHQGHLCEMVISGRMPGVLAYNAYAECPSTVAQRLARQKAPGACRD